MVIRKAEAEDLPLVAALCAACTENMNGNGISQWDEFYPTEEIFRQDIADGTMLVAAEPGKISGCVVLNTHQDEEYREIAWRFAGPSAVVHRLMVLPEAEGTGLAGRLLAAAEESAGALGCASVRLDYFSKNPRAAAFYKKHGYFTRGTVRFRKGPFFCAEKPLGTL